MNREGAEGRACTPPGEVLSPHRLRDAGTRIPLLALCGSMALILLACAGSLRQVQSPLPGAAAVPAAPLRYSLVFMIHGDGNYLYHDSAGGEIAADQRILRKAIAVGKRSRGSEVFIFHQTAERSLFFFRQPDGEFSYYRDGLLRAQGSYRTSRREAGDRFGAEAGLYRQYRGRAGPSDSTVSLFLYFGHEIPEEEASGYDESDPGHLFSIRELSAGIRAFASERGERFDLVLLSSCFGGTPAMIAALAPSTRFVLASPENLYLSYFTVDPLKYLADHPRLDGHAIGAILAESTFRHLRSEIQTTIALALYDVGRTGAYLSAVRGSYERILGLRRAGSAGEATTPQNGGFERCDCADDSTFAPGGTGGRKDGEAREAALPGAGPQALPADGESHLEETSEGVEVLYRPARFGRMKGKKHHSGWECWRILPSASLLRPWGG